VHKLYSTPTLQDITTVGADLKRPLAHFEAFIDHLTDHINHYEALRSFNQQVANITKIQIFKPSKNTLNAGHNAILTLPHGRWTTITSSFTRDFNSFVDYLVSQYRNLPTDTKARGGNAYYIQKRKRGKGKDKGKRKRKSGKGKWHENGR
jgi:hypothetical protein